MDFKIDLTETMKNVEHEVKRQAIDHISRTTSSVTRRMFESGQYGTVEGLGHEIIRKKVEEVILSEDFGKRIDRVIDQEFDKVVGGAVRTVLNSKARKHLFQPTSPVEGERLTDIEELPRANGLNSHL